MFYFEKPPEVELGRWCVGLDSVSNRSQSPSSRATQPRSPAAQLGRRRNESRSEVLSWSPSGRYATASSQKEAAAARASSAHRLRLASQRANPPAQPLLLPIDGRSVERKRPPPERSDLQSTAAFHRRRWVSRTVSSGAAPRLLATRSRGCVGKMESSCLELSPPGKKETGWGVQARARARACQLWVG